MQTNHQTLSFFQSTFPFLSGISTKLHFSAYQSAYQDGVMFALYKNDKLYLRKSAKHLKMIKQAVGFLEFLADPKIKLQTQLFYYFPKEYYPILLCHPEWIVDAIEEYKTQKEKLEEQHQDKIRYMKNIDLRLERLFNKIGITTINEFILLGEANIAIKLIEHGFELSPLLLFKIHGAIHKKYIYHLTPQEKQLILEKVDQALYLAGFRKYFSK